MSARLDFRGVRLSAYAPPDSFAHRRRKDRVAHIRGWLLHESTIFWGMCAVAAGIVAAVCKWMVG